MTSRQARRERRAAERKARKAELKRLKAASELSRDREGADPDPGFVSQITNPAGPEIGFVPQTADSPHVAVQIPSALGFVSQNSPRPTNRAEINRVNALHSTGPRTPQGKLASSRNSLKHGLASGELIIAGEDPAAYDQLLHDLMESHQPTNATEELLVQEMAQSWWLTQRAIRLQNECFIENGFDEKRLALFLRYQSTHGRAFHKALNALLRMKKHQSGFVSQTDTEPRPTGADGFVSQNSVSADSDTRFCSQNPRATNPNLGFVSQNRSNSDSASGFVSQSATHDPKSPANRPLARAA